MSLSEQPSAAAEWRAHWTLVLTSAMGMALASAMAFAMGVMIIPIEQEFGWSRAQISSGPLLVSITGILLSTAAGYAIDRLGARRVGIMVALAMSGILALLGTTSDNLWHWWLLWGIFGVAAAFTSTVWLTPVSSVFRKGRGLAIAITLTGTGISAALVPVVANYFVEHHGWRMGYFALGAFFAVATIPLVLAFWRGAEELSSSSAEPGTASPAMLPGMTVREGFTSPNFYKILFAFLISSVAGVAIILNLVPLLIFTGISPGQAAAIAGAHGLASIAGRLVGGWALDRLSAKWLVTSAAMVSAALPLGLLIGPGSVPIALAAVLINGFLLGVKFPGIVYLISRYFGARSFGTLFGTISIATAIAGGAGPMLANLVYDLTQSYTPVLWAAVPGFLVATLLFASLGRYPHFSAGSEQ